MGKDEAYWAIFTGKVLLPFTIRKTKKQCVFDFKKEHFSNLWDDIKKRGYACKKVIINEYCESK